jgi:hypothetical protein
MPNAAAIREFRVRHRDEHHARVFEAPSFEVAVIAFLESCGGEVGDGGDLKVVVADLETGDEHCFSIDLATGEAEPCA